MQLTTNLILEIDETEDDLDLVGVTLLMGERLRDAGPVDSIFNSISCSRRAVSTGLAAPNIDDGSAEGAGFVSKGFERGCSSILGRVFGSSATVQIIKSSTQATGIEKIELQIVTTITPFPAH